MANYMMRYKGKYRVLCELDMDTNDFPRNSDGKIDDDVGLYIPCKYNGKIYAYGREGKYMQLCAYIPSRTRGRNIKKQMDKDKVPYHRYDETDEEVSFLFPSTEIDIVAKLVGAKVSGANISPFSSKNLPRTKVEIPTDKMQVYKDITSRLNRNDMLVIKAINKSFMDEILAKKLRPKGQRKPYDYREEQKKLGLARDVKGYIYKKGMMDEYLSYLDEKVTEHLNNQQEGNTMYTIAMLEARKNRLTRNGKNSEGQGVLRKIEREIRKLKNA